MVLTNLASIVDGKVPSDCCLPVIARLFPCHNLRHQCPNVGNAARQALFGQHTQFNLGHVQPRGMFGRVVKAQAVHNSIGLLFAEELHESDNDGCSSCPVLHQ